MEEMDDIYSQIQMTLMKKDSECGGLKYLSSRTTDDNSRYINDISHSLQSIIQLHSIPIAEKNSKTSIKCVETFKYLLLNTNFQCQEQLIEDIVNGHLVDMIPPLSSYLLLEILYYLKLEDILAESLLYIPLDLCKEILQMSQRSSAIMERARYQDFTINLILNSYKKIILLQTNETQSLNAAEGLETLAIHITELITTIVDKMMTQFTEVGLKKYESTGLALRQLIKLIKTCLECEKTGISLSPDMVKLYRVTFSRKFVVKCSEEAINTQLTNLNVCLLNSLMNMLKKVDVKMYLEWAELDMAGNPQISLQNAIGTDCYEMTILLKDFPDLQPCSALLVGLEQISVKPQVVKASDNLADLCEGLKNGRIDCLRELMTRYELWDVETFQCISQHMSELTKTDFSTLLEYLTALLLKPGQEEQKQFVYNTVTRLLIQLDIPDVYAAILGYILKHNGANNLETADSEEMFKNFIFHNGSLRSPANLRIILFFLVKNPHKFLTILMKIAIGCSEYSHVMIPPEDFVTLSAIMNIREENGDTILLNILKKLIQTSNDWDSKKFLNFITVLVKKSVFSADECINRVLIPSIDGNRLPVMTIKFLIFSTSRILPLATENLDFKSLLPNLAGTMTFLREKAGVCKHTIDEIIKTIVQIVKSVVHYHKKWIVAAENKKTIEKTINILQPIDQLHFYELWGHKNPTDITGVLMDYRRRVENAVLRANKPENPEINLNKLKSDFQRHLILNSTQSEFVKVAGQIVVVHWDVITSNTRTESDENDALVDFITLSLETVAYCLEFPHETPTNSFIAIIQSLVRFLLDILQLEDKWEYSRVSDCLKHNFSLLSRSLTNRKYADFHSEALVFINNEPNNQTDRQSLLTVVASMSVFAKKCLESPETFESRFTPSPATVNLKNSLDFVRDCLALSEVFPNSVAQRLNEFCGKKLKISSDASAS